jgi:polyphosphate kinase
LIQAAEAGKQVVTLVELTARFDEEANIDLARALEEAGVHVVYGVVGLKAHGKTTLVVRREPDGIRRYGHVGTGNYNPDTARTYEDLGLFSADPALCADLADLFNYLTGYSKLQRFRKLWVAPRTLRATLRSDPPEMEAGDGSIAIKVNGLDDPELVDALYAASQAGIRDRPVRARRCGLRPGVPGLPNDPRALARRRFLSTRACSASAATRAVTYAIGSADLMARNLDRRVEVVMPVEDRARRASARYSTRWLATTSWPGSSTRPARGSGPDAAVGECPAVAARVRRAASHRLRDSRRRAHEVRSRHDFSG